MVAADGRLYVANHSGDTFVLRASPKFERLATNSLGEHTGGSIAVSDGKLFLGTHQALWCIGTKRQARVLQKICRKPGNTTRRLRYSSQ